MTKNNCVYCGNNQVPHRVNWYFESLNILLTPVRQLVLYNPITKFLAHFGWGQNFAKIALAVGKALKIITIQPDIKKCKVRRAQVLWEEAGKRGIEMQELVLFGKPFDCYVAEKADSEQWTVNSDTLNTKPSTMVFSGLPRPAGYFNPWLDLMDDKWKLKEKFVKAGLPVPMGASCNSFSQAKKIFQKIQTGSCPAIVKPRAGSRGRHSTTFVSSPEELKIAFRIAKQLCYWVMVEQQLVGPVYRATVINFKLEGVLRGDAPNIVGNGSHTISELIEQKNKSNPSGVKDIQVNRQAENFLARQDLQLSSIPRKDEEIYLSEKIGVNYGGSSSEDYEICHPENKELFEHAAKILGDPLVGFDFIIPDISKSYKIQTSGFIEVNSLPFINLHHDPLLGQPRNIAAKVWDMVI